MRNSNINNLLEQNAYRTCKNRNYCYFDCIFEASREGIPIESVY